MLPDILLVDNGSTKPSSTLRLRLLSEQLTQLCQLTVLPVSLAHADKIDPADIEGSPAHIFSEFMTSRLQQGQRDFIVLPLFFGPSKAISSAIPEQVQQLKEKFGDFNLHIADTIYPLPAAEIKLIELLASLTLDCIHTTEFKNPRCVLVDHGSPSPPVTAVREHITQALQATLPDISIDQAVMERRSGKEYDFNGQLLEDWLKVQAEANANEIIVIQLFFLPGRHAGPGGDIEQICVKALTENPNTRIVATALVSEHPLILEILRDRLISTLKSIQPSE